MSLLWTVANVLFNDGLTCVSAACLAAIYFSRWVNGQNSPYQKKKKKWIRKSMSAPPTLPTVASSTCRLQSIMHYFHAIPLIPTQVLLLCSSCAHFIIDKTPRTRRGTNISSSHWCPSLPTLHPHCCNQWSECHCPHTGCCLSCFSELSQLTSPNLFAAT